MQHKVAATRQAQQYVDLWGAVSFHGFLQKSQCGLVIATLGDKGFQDFTIVVNCAPQIMCLAIDPHEHFVQVPTLIQTVMHLALPYFGCEHRPKVVPPISNRSMANIDSAFVQQIFHITKRYRKPDIHHDGQANDIGGCFEVTEWILVFHPLRVERPNSRLKEFSSDISVSMVFPDQQGL